VLTVVGKPTGDDKFFLVKQQEQVDGLYGRLGKAKYGNVLEDDVVFAKELARWETLHEVLKLRQK
jgi:hypothetical protein